MHITGIERTILAVTLAALAGAVTIAQQSPGQDDNDQGFDIEVSAQQQWIPTGIVVQQGDTLRFEATGEIALNRNRSVRARAGGAANQLDRTARMPSVPVGTLIGQINSRQRTGAPFVIGDRASVTMPADGELHLGVNDSSFSDNTGAFAVWIEVPSRDDANDGQGEEFRVSAQQQWMPTGIIVSQGEVMQFASSGDVTLTRNGARMPPGGATNVRLDRAARLPSAPVGSLIGRIGPASQRTSRPFPIGDRTSVTMPGNGELFLGVNDSTFADNGGAFSVWIDAGNEGRGRGRGRGRGNNTGNDDFFGNQGRDVQVQAREPWVATGITVRQGDVVRLRTTGEVALNQDGSLRARSNGTSVQLDAGAPLPNMPVGALVGRIGAAGNFFQRNRVFVIGDQTSVSMPADGELFLGINDSNFDDNSGAFTVRIETR